MTRTELTDQILAAKRIKRLSWKQIAEAVGGGSQIPITAALLGQMRLDRAQAEKAATLLGLGAEGAALLEEVPYRGSPPPTPPADPLIYRFYELVQVYGSTWKELIQEEFGDGIMSAVDLEMTLERAPDPGGDRVKLQLTGKFLPYRRY